ncbi:hypothetical protein TWF706_011095, partial [Orbilia oligospora]
IEVPNRPSVQRGSQLKGFLSEIASLSPKLTMVLLSINLTMHIHVSEWTINHSNDQCLKKQRLQKAPLHPKIQPHTIDRIDQLLTTIKNFAIFGSTSSASLSG